MVSAIISISNINAQIIFFEDFNENGLAGTSNQGTGWNITCPTCGGASDVRSNGTVFIAQETNSPPAEFLSNPIDVSTYSKLQLTLDYDGSFIYAGSGNFESLDECNTCNGDPVSQSAGCTSCWDFIHVILELDGSTTFTYTVGLDQSTPIPGSVFIETSCFPVGTYSSAVIKLIVQTITNDEIFEIDNIQLEAITPAGNSSTITVNPSTTVCEGSSINFGITGNSNNPVWVGPNFNSTSPNPTIDPIMLSDDGTYILTTTDTDGCQNTTSVDIMVTPGPTATLVGGGQLCPGECTAIDVNISGGAPPYTLDLTFTSPTIPIPFNFPLPGFNITDQIIVCYSATAVFPSFDLATNTLTLPNIVGGNSGSLILNSITDNNSCSSTVPSNVSFTFLLKPMGTTATLEACDDGNGEGVFDFTSLESTILNGNAGTVTFYEDASLINVMSPPYIGPSTTIYAQISDINGCLSDPIPIELEVLLSGDAGDVFFTCGGGLNSCFICDSDGVPGEDFGIEISFADNTRDYEVEILYIINSIPNSYSATISGLGETISFNITGDAFFTIVAITPDGECTDVTDLPPTISINYEILPEIYEIGPFSDCNPVTLPSIFGLNLTGSGYYNTEPDGSGINYNEGDVINSSIELYAIDGYFPDCIAIEPVSITIGGSTTLLTPPSDTICGFYIFPNIPGQGSGSTAGYYTESNGNGINYMVGDTLLISDTIYVFDPNSNCPSNEPTFSILLAGGVQYDSLGTLSACEEIILPPVSGTGFTDSVRYYTSPNGIGLQYLIGDTIDVSDTLYIFDPNTLCTQDTTPVILEVLPVTTYTNVGAVIQCGNYILPNINGTNVSPNAMYFTSPNGGGQGYAIGDTIEESTTLYIFDTATICNANQPQLILTLTQKATYTLPQSILVCGSYTLETIEGENLSGNDNYYSLPFGGGDIIPVGTVFNSDTTIYIYSGSGPCPVNREIRIRFDELNSGSPENFSICSNDGPINLFDHLLPPYTTGGEWSEQGTAFFDISDPSEVVVPTDIPSGTYRFQYAVSSIDCGVTASVLRVEIVQAPIASNDTTVIACVGQNNLDLSLYTTANGSNIVYLYLDGSLPFTGSVVDISSLSEGTHNFRMITNNINPTFNITCTDSADITLILNSNPSAGEDNSGTYCIGSQIDLSALIVNSDDIGEFAFLQNQNLINGATLLTESLSSGTIEILHILDIPGACGADTAIFTISLLDQVDAGLNVNVAECGIGTFDLTDYLTVTDYSGEFVLVSGPFNLTNEMLTANSTGSGSIYYILGDGSSCPRDTAEIDLTILEEINTTYIDATCASTYVYEGVTFTPTSNNQLISLKTSSGCDSIVNVTITFSQSVTTDLTPTICSSDSISINGKIYNAGNLTALDTLFGMASGGCDSILNINVQLIQPSSSSINIITCDEDYSVTIGPDIYNILNTSGQTILKGEAANGCDSIIDINLQIELFNYTYEIVQPECESDQGVFTLNSFSGNDSLYVEGNGISSTLSQSDLPLSFTFTTGSYSLEIGSINRECVDEVEFELMDPIIPEVAIVATPLSDSTWQLSLEGDTEITTYFWTTSTGTLDCWDCPNPILTGDGEVLVIYDYGLTCVGNATTILEQEVDNTFNLPNIISTNNDGVNDDLTIFVSPDNKLTIKSFVIYDRWGNLMSKIENQRPNNGDILWDGRYNNDKVNPGVYVYVLVMDVDGVQQVVKGDVTVIR